MTSKTSKRIGLGIAIALWAVALCSSRDRCVPALLRYGLEIGQCPDGALRQTARLEASGLRRGASGWVTLQAIAHYTTDEADEERWAVLPDVTPTQLALVGARQVWPLEVADWDHRRGSAQAEVKLPVVPDGDYQLRASYESLLGAGEVSLPVALYAPARIHVITDRPLYEPGNTVRFRAVVLRARDLVPLDHRPGSWTVKDPDGEVLLEEAAPAGEWGVVSGSFPLDKAARTGAWKVAWTSATASDEVAFTVEPFTLPRFRVDAIADRPFYRPGDRPRIKGAVLYSSGAPVAGAGLEVAWEVGGAWPPPVDWQAGALPQRVAASPAGRFELVLPQIPADLQGVATLTARISAIDPAGDRATGVASVLLSQDGIAAQAVTELGDGLVENFNNRLYVRVTTPDGRVVTRTKLTVRRAWQPTDPGISAELDEDGVASLQIDPGTPVNVVIPAAPWRPAPRPPVVSRGEIRDLISGAGASLADQVAIDSWLPALAACAKWYRDSGEPVDLGLRIAGGGSVIAAAAGPHALDRCVVAAVTRQRLPAGPERLYAVEFEFTEPVLPSLAVALDGAWSPPDGFEEALVELARGARDCLPRIEGRLASLLGWRARAGSKEVELTGWIADASLAAERADGGDGGDGGEPEPEAGAGRAAHACVTGRIARGARIALAEAAEVDALGVARFTVALPDSEVQSRPQPTTMVGYELLVTAETEGRPTTVLRIPPGVVPDLRLRVTPVLARPGDSIAAQLIRGPNFTGSLPEKLALDCLTQHTEAKLDGERRATLVLDGNDDGWCRVSGGGAHALVYVRPRAELTVSVVPGRDRYAPGDRAELAIQTLVGGQGGKAAVGLFGVDDSLGQLVPLPGGDALGRIRPKVETTAPAFGVLDGQALTLGRIRGANAAAATVLRVSAIPSVPELDAVVNGHAESRFDPIAELTDRFYLVLAELHARARSWETTAPAAEKMTPATMAALWNAAVAACAARGDNVNDAYGRPLRLSRLPPDLLALTDPRAVVVVATRLTEDVENWPAWVGREKP